MQANLLGNWRNHFVLEEDMLEIETTAVTPSKCFEVSGHCAKFTGPFASLFFFFFSLLFLWLSLIPGE